MTFDHHPIYLDRSSLETLMDDTDQNKLCWMYHDVLSDPKIAWMFDQYAGKGTPVREAWTTMAWVAASQQEGSFYLVFKWYSDFYGPPQEGAIYLVERDQGPAGELRVRSLNMDFQYKMSPQGQAWCASLWGRISRNATSFFGESDYESSTVARMLRVMEENPGREMEAIDQFLGVISDREKGRQCATIGAYFQCVQEMAGIINSIVGTDGGENVVHHMHTGELLELLPRFSDGAKGERTGRMVALFRRLAREYLTHLVRAPELSRGTGRQIMDRSREGLVRWLRLRGGSSCRLLRELYWRVAPDQAWDVFHRWQGEVFFTVIRRPVVRGMARGVYVLARFEDQTGLDVTDLFWLENLSGGVVHLCQGEFFDELLDQLLDGPVREDTMTGSGWQSGDFIARTIMRLKQVYDRSFREGYAWKGY